MPVANAGYQAVLFTDHGGTDVIEYAGYPDPVPGRDEVPVDVKAGAFNGVELWTRRAPPAWTSISPMSPGVI